MQVCPESGVGKDDSCTPNDKFVFGTKMGIPGTGSSKGSVRSIKRSLRSTNTGSSVAIKTAVMSREDGKTQGFSTSNYAALYGSEFMRFLGMPEGFQPAQTRIHIMIKQENTVNGHLMGFSFPLCGYDHMSWNAQSVLDALQKQVCYFAHYVKSEQLLMVIQHAWHSATVEVIQSLDGASRRHMVITLLSTARLNQEYTYVHEDSLSEGRVKARGIHHLAFIREGSSVIKACIKDILDVENPHGKEPMLKARRLAEISL